MGSSERRRHQRQARRNAARSKDNFTAKTKDREISNPSPFSTFVSASRWAKPMMAAARLMRLRVCNLLCWIWNDKALVVTWLLRITTVISFSYLIYDRIYETGVTISAAASDPKNPFYFPFAIINNSHIFEIMHIKYNCGIENLKTNNNFSLSRVGFVVSNEFPRLDAGGILNISCKRALGFGNGVSVVSAVAVISVDYETNIFSLYSLKRHQEMKFTWAADTSNPQWIRGEMVP